ncbi:MAG TPA: winged helix DNA-binding domain-containing protein [Thermoleophilaceae bacterium]|nr:winged helix DNA-binding domain-containing protein [Thermoleophilaceae bacterium]
MPIELTWPQALAWRMRRHHLIDRAAPREMLQVTARIGGLHAQVMSSAELTLHARVDGLEREAVAEALWHERSLVKLWAMRGTLHLLPAAELDTWLSALATYDHYLKPVWLRGFDITEERLEALIEAIGEALDGRLLTREELGAAVAQIAGAPELAEKVQGSWGPYLKPASFHGRLCFGPSDGQKVRFTRPDTWLGRSIDTGEQEEALLEVTRRHLGAFGPAAREDLARWWGVQPAPGGRMLEALGEEVAAVDVDGTAGWMLREHAEEAAAEEPAERLVRLLPGFDMWAIGAARDAAALLDPAEKKRVYRNQGWISPVLLVNGRMDGVWKHERKGKRLTVTIEPFGKPPRWARTQAESEAERLAGFLGGELEIGWAS